MQVGTGRCLAHQHLVRVEEILRQQAGVDALQEQPTQEPLQLRFRELEREEGLRRNRLALAPQLPEQHVDRAQITALHQTRRCQQGVWEGVWEGGRVGGWVGDWWAAAREGDVRDA